ncbi:MAG TPA: adenylyl-sulfate kinase, partial [Ilumatobacteraceae bacterium]|nr:adenylyl-sulfate kinase [Ilumatobacteraceae bacterium]
EQYTRNMITGASTADAAVILIDARKGVITQTRRHSYLVSLLGIRRIVLAVNKLDLVGFSEEIFRSIVAQYEEFAAEIGLHDVVAIPISALLGDNITVNSANTPWYDGPSLISHLETVPIDSTARVGPFRFPVQWVNRPSSEFRGFSGTVVGGSIRVGDAVRVLPSGTTSRIATISTFDRDLDEAVEGQAVTLCLTDEVDVSRGSVICAADDPAGIADQFEAHIVWMHEAPLQPGRQYLLKSGPTTAAVTISRPKDKIDVNTLERLAARTLALNEIGVCTITTDRPIPFDTYHANRDTGGFVVIDRMTNATVGAGMINFALRRASNVQWQALDVTPEARASMKGHQPGVVWLTGLSGAGKSTIANGLERSLHARGVHTFLLDGDNVRHGLNRDLGFTEADRIENIRRVVEVARLMIDAGLVVIVSFISPFRAERERARQAIGDGRYVEIFVDAPLAVAEQRDPKGLYAKARNGLLPNFTGIDSPYEPPPDPDIHIDTTTVKPADAAETIVAHLVATGMIH